MSMRRERVMAREVGCRKQLKPEHPQRDGAKSTDFSQAEGVHRGH